MKVEKITTKFFMMVGFLSMHMACGDSIRTMEAIDDIDEIENIGQNLFIDKASPTEELSGSYEKDGEIIFFEAVRGNETIDGGEFGGPKYEIDVRFFDQYGYIFIGQNGGGKPIDNRWDFNEEATQRAIEHRSIKEIDRERDFLLARKAGFALKNLLDSKTVFVSEIWPSEFSKEKMMPELNAIVLNALDDDTVPSGSNGETVSFRAGRRTAYEHIFRAYYKVRIKGVWEHSGTRQWLRISGHSAPLRKWRNCNHSDCPGHNGMKEYCVKVYKNRGENIKAGQNCSGTYGSPHNCHDDTVLQYRDIRDNVYHSTSSGTCGWDGKVSSLHPKFPNCIDTDVDYEPGPCGTRSMCGNPEGAYQCCDLTRQKCCGSYCVLKSGSCY